MNTFYFKNLTFSIFGLVFFLSCTNDSKRSSYYYDDYYYYYSDYYYYYYFYGDVSHVNFVNLIQPSKKSLFFCDYYQLNPLYLEYAKPSGYFDVYPGTTIFSIIDSIGTLKAQKEIPLSYGNYISIFAIEDTDNAITLVSFKDELLHPVKNKSMIRFINLSASSKSITIKENRNELVKRLSFKNATAFIEIPNGQYNFNFEDSEKPSELLFQANVKLKKGSIYTVYCSNLIKEDQDTIKNSFDVTVVENY